MSSRATWFKTTQRYSFFEWTNYKRGLPGGKSYDYDTMHFKYRLELFEAQRLPLECSTCFVQEQPFTKRVVGDSFYVFRPFYRIRALSTT